MSSVKKIIDVPYPLNMAEKDKFKYEPYLRYELLLNQLCDGGADYFEGDYIVDAASLERNLALMCGRVL